MTLYQAQSIDSLLSAFFDPNGDTVTFKKINGVDIDWATTNPHVITTANGKWRIWQDGVNSPPEFDDEGSSAGNPAGGVTVTQNVTFTLTDGTTEVGPFTLALRLTGIASPDTVGPIARSISPSGISVSVNARPQISFDEDVLRGTGTLQIWNGTTNNLIEAINVATAPETGPGSIAYANNRVTVWPTLSLPAGAQIDIRFATGVFKDAAGNDCQAATGNTWTFITAAGTSGSADPEPDTVVATAAAVNALIDGWIADWAGTVPAGKNASDDRCIGISAPILGSLSLTGKNLPQRVYLRAVGTFSTGYACTSYVQGAVNISNSTNLWFYLMDLRVPNAQSYFNGFVTANGTTNCAFVRCAFSGLPFTPAQGVTGTTVRAIQAIGGNNLLLKHCVYRFFQDGFIKLRGTHNTFTCEGNCGLYTGGDDYTWASDVVINDFFFIANLFDRHHAKALGNHNDGFQLNTGGIINRATIRYNVGYRGDWTGTGVAGASENGWQLMYTAAGGAGTGPHLAEHNIFANGQQRGIDRIAGVGPHTYRCNLAIDTNVAPGQKANATFPSIRGASVAEKNIVVVPNANYSSQEGVGGRRITIGSSPNYNLLLSDFNEIPTDLTDLTALEPKPGTRGHPGYTPAVDRDGPYEYWEKVYAGDPQVVLSKVGWPVAELYRFDFDRTGKFDTSYTGTFDANGRNV